MPLRPSCRDGRQGGRVRSRRKASVPAVAWEVRRYAVTHLLGDQGLLARGEHLLALVMLLDGLLELSDGLLLERLLLSRMACHGR